ncbi:MAG TPA: hypothetical protein VLJ59_13425 [Mycobacteriales bacterium]|nr:hypothetical protein [Mycobacteriales bacterium]
MAGVPLCMVLFGRDQLEVSRRVVEAGAAADALEGLVRVTA